MDSIVSLHNQNNSTGDSTVTPTSLVHTEQIAFSGSAGTRNVVLTPADFPAGAIIKLLCLFPTLTAGIVVNVYSAAVQADPIFTFTTDDEQPNALFEAVNDGLGDLLPISSEIPAFPTV